MSLGPYLCITVVVPANNDFRGKKLPKIVGTMNHCRSAPLRRSQQSTTLTRHRKLPIENRSCAGLWTITKDRLVGKSGIPNEHYVKSGVTRAVEENKSPGVALMVK